MKKRKWHIYTMESYSAIKGMNYKQQTKWMNYKHQARWKTLNTKDYILCNLFILYSGKGKTAVMGSSSCWDWGWGAGLTDKRTHGILWGDGNVLKLDYGGSCPTKDMHQAHGTIYCMEITPQYIHWRDLHNSMRQTLLHGQLRKQSYSRFNS